MLREIGGLGEQLRTSYAAASAALPALPSASTVIVVALGGSAIGADLAEAVWRDRLRLPVVPLREAELPGWATTTAAAPLVVAVSYSGETAETLAAAAAALALGLPLVAVTSGGRLASLARSAGSAIAPVAGGLPPRAALGRLFGALAAVLERAGAVPAVADDIEAAAAACDAAAAGSDARAAKLGAELADCSIWAYGAGPLYAVARRLKTQLNENAKAVAAFAALPEADHNEICGWAGTHASGGRNAAVYLTDTADSKRVQASVERSCQLIAADADVVEILAGEGPSRLARAFWLLAFVDRVSVHVAAAAGVDPFATERLDDLKRHLAAAEGR